MRSKLHHEYSEVFLTGNLGQFAALPALVPASCRCWCWRPGPARSTDATATASGVSPSAVAVAVGPVPPSRPAKKPHARVLPGGSSRSHMHPAGTSSPAAHRRRRLQLCSMVRAPHARLSPSRRAADRVYAGHHRSTRSSSAWPPPSPYHGLGSHSLFVFFSFSFLEQKKWAPTGHSTGHRWSFFLGPEFSVCQDWADLRRAGRAHCSACPISSLIGPCWMNGAVIGLSAPSAFGLYGGPGLILSLGKTRVKKVTHTHTQND